jgi:glycosyltransferase involved in cell wall biosynthesis
MTGNHLCHNPRVIKEADLLVRSGYNVIILGGWFDRRLMERDKDLLRSLRIKFYPVMNVTEKTTSTFMMRFRRKIGFLTYSMFKIENRWQLGYAYSALRRAAFRQKADLYIAHSEQAMAVAVDLRRDGRKVGVDLEDWFSQDLLPEARRHRPILLLQSLERDLLTRGAYAACPSKAMSNALADEFRCAPPAVVYNAFSWSERVSIDGLLRDRNNQRVPSIHWFSQTLGVGRGLEDLLAALPFIDHAAEIHLRGNPVAGFDLWLRNRLPETWRDRVFIHGLVPNEELLSRIAEHDIGFAGEMNFCRSRDLTVTNKILYYLLAGLAVVASDTDGQQEVAGKAPGAVFLYPTSDVHALADRVNALLSSQQKLKEAKVAALRAAEQTFCWERQEDVLLNAVALALS